MKKLFCFIMILIIFSVTGCNMIESTVTEGKEIDGVIVIASVNDDNIPKDEFVRNVEREKLSMENNYGPNVFKGDQGEEQYNELREMVLENMIIQALVFQKGKELGIEATDESVKEQLDIIKEQYGGEEAFFEITEELGLDIEDINRDLKYLVVVEGVIEELRKGIEVTEAEARNYYENNQREFKLSPDTANAKHILVEKEEEAQSILDKLSDGEDFGELAKEYSLCDSKHDGGNLGDFSRGQMVEAFENAVFEDMEVGETSDIVETMFGYHIIRLLDMEIYPVQDFEDIKEGLVERLEEEKVYNEFQSIIDEMKENSSIEKYM